MSEVKNLTKSEAVAKLAVALNLSKVAAEKVYDTYNGIVAETLATGGRVRIPGVGVLHKEPVAARSYPVPGKGEKIEKPAGTKYKLSSKTQY